MKFQQVREFLRNFDLTPETPATLTLEQYTKVIETAKKWYGGVFGQWLMDYFMPTGEPVSKGFEDSLSHYVFLPSTWKEMEDEFNNNDLLKAL